MIALLVLSILLSASIGQVEIPLLDTFKILMDRLFHVELAGYAEIPSAYFNVVWMIRFPRALIAAAVGIGLSLCGIVMQAAVENPLADPYILGISSGATLGATFALMVGVGTLPLIGQASVSASAFAGALLASFLVLFFANIGGHATGAKLVLSGTVINSMFSAFSNIMIYFANNAQALQNITFWIMGSTASATWSKVPAILVIVALTALFFPDPKQHLESDADGRRSRHHAGHQPYFLA